MLLTEHGKRHKAQRVLYQKLLLILSTLAPVAQRGRVELVARTAYWVCDGNEPTLSYHAGTGTPIRFIMGLTCVNKKNSLIYLQETIKRPKCTLVFIEELHWNADAEELSKRGIESDQSLQSKRELSHHFSPGYERNLSERLRADFSARGCRLESKLSF